jgi:chaperonin cofactor prefoldin
MNKSVYHVLVWTIIAVLAVGLVFFLGRFRYANTITKNMRQDKEELQVKVDQLRKRMLEKEQELRRQLQDEINKRLG